MCVITVTVKTIPRPSSDMSREIRITIDDDEIFESMKRRKGALDLSWEEVVKRGLREEPVEGRPRGPSAPSGPGQGDWGEGDAEAGGFHEDDRGRDRGRAAARRARDRAREARDRARRRGRGDRDRHGGDWPTDPFADDFGDRLSRQIKESVARSLSGSMEGLVEGLGEEFDEFGGSFDELESAEDAVLTFPFLDAEDADPEAHTVPLRVHLRSSPDGLEIDVVTVRMGKDVTGTNRFGQGARGLVVGGLADGEDAVLELAEGAERYAVDPALSWSRAADGTPTVTDVEIREAEFVRGD